MNQEQSEIELNSVTNSSENNVRLNNYYYNQSRSLENGGLESNYSQIIYSNNHLNQLNHCKTSKFHYSVAEFNKFKNKLLFKTNQNQKNNYRSSSHYNLKSNNSSNYFNDDKANIVESPNLHRAIYETIQRSNSSNPKILSIDLKRSNYFHVKKNRSLLSSLLIKKIY